MNAVLISSRKPSSRLGWAAPLVLAAAALLAGPSLGACDGSAPGVLLASDNRNFAFTDVQTSATSNFRLSIAASAVPSVNAATLGFAVDVVVGGPTLEVSVTPPGGTASVDTTPETVTSSGVTYNRYIVTVGDTASLCPETGACTLDFAVVISRTSPANAAFTAIATVSGVITGEVISAADVALDFI